MVPIHEISKIFYADTGKILNIGSEDDSNNPVLLLKRDVHAEPPRRLLQRSASQMSSRSYGDARIWQDPWSGDKVDITDEQSEVDAQLYRESTPASPNGARDSSHEPGLRWRLPVDLDPEWMAFEVYAEEPNSVSDFEEDDADSRPTSSGSEDTLSREITKTISELKLNTPSPQAQHAQRASPVSLVSPAKLLPAAKIKTSLSLLEMLIKLTALQQFRQDSHLAIEDELLNFFLEDSATAGAGVDKEFRQRLRHDAVRRVGFDPYDESPIKRRGEEYIQASRSQASPRPDLDVRRMQLYLGPLPAEPQALLRDGHRSPEPERTPSGSGICRVRL